MKPFIILMVLLGIGFTGVRYVCSNAIRQYFDIKTFLAVGVTLAAGFFLHTAMQVMLIAGFALLLASTGRMDSLCRSLIIVVLTPDIGQFISAGGVYLTFVSAPDVLGVAALIACYRRAGVSRSRGFSVEDALLIVLFFCFGIAAVRTGSFTGIQRTAFTIGLQIGVPYFLYRRFVNDRAEFAQIIGVFAACAAILGFVAVCESRIHWAVYTTIYTNQAQFLASKDRGGLLRVPASFADPTAYALFAALGILAVITSRRFFQSTPKWYGSLALAILGMLAAQSRGADLGLLMGLFLMLAVRRRYALAAAVAGGAAMAVALLVALASSVPKIAAFIGANQEAGTAQDYRQILLRRGLQVGMDHPMLGDDMKNVIAKMSDIIQGEGIVDFVNTYLTIFLNSGIVGLTVVTGLIIAVLAKLFSLNKKVINDSDFISCQMFIAGALGAELLALLFTPAIYERNAYWLVILLAGCRSVRIPGQGSSKLPPRKLVQSLEFMDVGGRRVPQPALAINAA